MGAEVVDLQHPGVVVAPQAALAAERRDAALHADARTSEGGEVTGSADDASGFADLLLWLRGSVASFHGCRIVLRAGDGSQPAAPGEAGVSGLAPRRLLIGPHPVGNSLEPCDTRLPALFPRAGAGSCRFVEAYTRLVRPWQAPDEREKPLFVQHHRGGRLALRTVAQIVERGGGSKRSREACRPSHLPPFHGGAPASNPRRSSPHPGYHRPQEPRKHPDLHPCESGGSQRGGMALASPWPARRSPFGKRSPGRES